MSMPSLARESVGQFIIIPRNSQSAGRIPQFTVPQFNRCSWQFSVRFFTFLDLLG